MSEDLDAGLSDGPPWPNGHFYSPVPSIDDVWNARERIFAVPPTLPGIDLRTDEQLSLLEEFRLLYADQPFTEEKTEDRRYYFDNAWFNHGDAIVLHCMLRHLRPARVVEVGSGFSSAVILDTNDEFLYGGTRCTFVEPYPDRLRALLRPGDETRVRIIEQPLQEVDTGIFSELAANDVLFIDSTHVSKVGSDVNTLIFDVLPMLRPGVVVHVHDIFYPFEYPKEWVFYGLAWNEAYVLRSFLMFNGDFRILFFNSYLQQFHAETVVEALPLWARNAGGSIWMQRVGG